MVYSDQLQQHLINNSVAIMRTDTLYGIVGRASSEEVVERIFTIKGRTPSKPPILLVGELSQLLDQYDHQIHHLLTQYWPGPHSIILPSAAAPHWIARDTGSVAYRIPASESLRSLLMRTGPLIAPSANPEGQPPATTIEEARSYFENAVDYYEDGGTITDTTPSKLYQYDAGRLIRLR